MNVSTMRRGVQYVALPVLVECPLVKLNPRWILKDVVPGCPEFGVEWRPEEEPTFGTRMVKLHKIGPYRLAYVAELDTLFCARA